MAENGHDDIDRLFDSAARFLAGGLEKEAEELIRRAQSESPHHPLALNENARRLLLRGEATAAYGLLKEALSKDASRASIWLNLAAALRALGHRENEMVAVEQALIAEPRNVRALLQKASLQELQGQRRAAAMSYRNLLQSLPAGALPPETLRSALQHALQFVAANDLELEKFLESRLQQLRTRHASEPLQRFDRCLEILLRKQPVYRPQPSFMYFPQLPALEFYDRSAFPWLDSIEAETDEIRAELINVLQGGSAELEPYSDIPAGSPINQWQELNKSRRWSVYYLWQEGVPIADHIARCPRTVEALKSWPRCEVPGSSPTAVFSILDAKTRIPAHTGVANTRLMVHLPLIVPPGCGFRVGGERREWRAGHAFVFDDTFEHEAWNDGDVPRAVLIFDIWSPYMSIAERELVAQLSSDIGEFYSADAISPGSS
jgi:aspartyl/asparaginyl beta-hydroxylase (cupin superfamily)